MREHGQRRARSRQRSRTQHGQRRRRARAARRTRCRRRYSYHYNGHMPIGPSCCGRRRRRRTARRSAATRRTCYSTRDCGSRGRAGLTLPANQIRVTFYEGSSVVRQRLGAYDDAPSRRRVMSKPPGKPVRLQFMRWDEHGWDDYGPAQLMDMRGGVDASGNIVAYDVTLLRAAARRRSTRRVAGTSGCRSDARSDSGRRQRHDEHRARSTTLANQRRDRQDRSPLNDGYFKSGVAAGAGRAGRRRSPTSRRSTSWPSRPRWIRRSSGSRTCSRRPTRTQRWHDRWSAAAKAGELEAVGRRLEARATENVVTGRGIALGSYGGPHAARRRRHPGEQEDRQDHRHAHLRGAGLRPRRQPGA